MSKIKEIKNRAKSKRKTLKSKNDHGGSLAIKKRRSQRPLNIKQSHHITMKSHHAIGSRSLFKHKKMILSLMRKNSAKFHVKVYEYAIQGNHIHLLVKAKTREGLQNFFRVFAGHVAQRILKDFPLTTPLNRQTKSSGKVIRGGASYAPNLQEETAVGCKKNQRKFWSYLLYSRIVSWGKDFKCVVSYIQKNTLELLQIIAYEPRIKAYKPRILINLGINKPTS